MTTGAAPAAEDNRLDRLWRWIRLIEDGLLALLLSLMIVLAGLQIVLRNVWDAGLVWGDPLLRVLVLWTGLLGAMAATRDDNHITIDVLSRFLPPRVKNVARLITDLFAAAVCALLTWHGARFVLLDREFGVLAFGAVPAWVCELILPVGFGIMALRFFLASLRRIKPPER